MSTHSARPTPLAPTPLAPTLLTEWDERRLEFQANIIGDKENLAMAAVGLPENGHVLDVGCGPGAVSARLAREWPGLHFDGLDRDPVLLDIAARHMDSVFEGDLLTTTSLGQDRYDAAFARLALRHVAHPAAAVERMVSLVRPGGRVVLIDAIDDSLRVSPPIADLVNAQAACRSKVLAERPEADPRAGEHLEQLAKDARLVDIRRQDVTLTLEDCETYDGPKPLPGDWSGPRGFMFFLGFLHREQFNDWDQNRRLALEHAMIDWTNGNGLQAEWTLSIVGGARPDEG